MPTSEARVLANQQNALRSTGPKTSEGKAVSRGNSYKHGLTGDGVVVSNADADKIEQRTRELTTEFRPGNATERMLVERMAVQGVRMERSVERECAAISENVRRAEDEFEAPEGLDEATVAQLRREAGRIALFDPSKEACLARKYEAAAERGFYKALKELRQLAKEQKTAEILPQAAPSRASLGSFSPAAKPAPPVEVPPAPAPRSASKTLSRLIDLDLPPLHGPTADVRFSIGRAV